MMRNSLPEFCYVRNALTGGMSKVIRGENAFFGVHKAECCEDVNAALGVTPAQQSAMVGGVLFGWHSHHADPAQYDDQGYYRGPQETRKEGF